MTQSILALQAERRRPGSEPTRPRRILLVADRTASGRHVHEALAERDAQAPIEVTLLVPASPKASGWTWDETEARSDARRRMNAAARSLRHAGFRVTCVLGDFSPIEAIGDELRLRDYDEIVISTLPSRISRWLSQDLPARLARQFDLPVTHIEATSEPSDVPTPVGTSFAA